MADILDVAKYILQCKGKMSTWKLQKLCYYAQAWSIAWTEKPLFTDNFEAWANGPVCPKLFNIHRGLYTVDEEDISQGDIGHLTEDEIDSINVIINDYGNKEPYDLREMTHNEAPWKIARGNLSEGEKCNTVISKESMGEYYGRL